MTEAQLTFITDAARSINAIKGSYGIEVASPIIAQMILESGWGKSKLASEYHNYFGLTAGSKWTGKKASMPTKEEVGGTLVGMTRDFRAYDSMEDGIKGYFEFINTARYANLKGPITPEQYIDNIIADGYCTASTYKSELMNLIEKYELEQYDKMIVVNIETLADEVCSGKHGNGEDRIKSLKQLGLSDDEIKLVQAAVNNRLQIVVDEPDEAKLTPEQFNAALVEIANKMLEHVKNAQ